MIVWLVEAIKNLHPCIVLNLIYIYPMPLIVELILIILEIYHRKLIPIFSLSLTIDNLVCGWIYGSSSPWIASYLLILFPRNLCSSHVSSLSLLKNLLINSLDSYQVLFWKTNLFLTVHCAIVKSVEGLVYLFEPCSFGEFAFSFLLTYFICLNEINLWACVALFIFYAQ